MVVGIVGVAVGAGVPVGVGVGVAVGICITVVGVGVGEGANCVVGDTEGFSGPIWPSTTAFAPAAFDVDSAPATLWLVRAIVGVSTEAIVPLLFAIEPEIKKIIPPITTIKNTTLKIIVNLLDGILKLASFINPLSVSFNSIFYLINS